MTATLHKFSLLLSVFIINKLSDADMSDID